MKDLNQLMYDWYDQTGQIRPAKTFKFENKALAMQTTIDRSIAQNRKVSTQFITNARDPEKSHNGMKTMTIILYLTTAMGLFLQGAQGVDIIPTVPDRITFSVIIGGLVAANMIQWRQSVSDRGKHSKSMEDQQREHRQEIKEMQAAIEHRQEIKEMQAAIMQLVKDNQVAIQAILKDLKS